MVKQKQGHRMSKIMNFGQFLIAHIYIERFILLYLWYQS